jgi:hypothetical protein
MASTRDTLSDLPWWAKYLILLGICSLFILIGCLTFFLATFSHGALAGPFIWVITTKAATEVGTAVYAFVGALISATPTIPAVVVGAAVITTSPLAGLTAGILARKIIYEPIIRPLWQIIKKSLFSKFSFFNKNKVEDTVAKPEITPPPLYKNKILNKKRSLSDPVPCLKRNSHQFPEATLGIPSSAGLLISSSQMPLTKSISSLENDSKSASHENSPKNSLRFSFGTPSKSSAADEESTSNSEDSTKYDKIPIIYYGATT